MTEFETQKQKARLDFFYFFSHKYSRYEAKYRTVLWLVLADIVSIVIYGRQDHSYTACNIQPDIRPRIDDNGWECITQSQDRPRPRNDACVCPSPAEDALPGNIQESLLLTRITLVTVWISNYIHYDVWGGITYPFPNFNGCTIEVWEWMINFVQHFIGNVISYPCCG